MKRTHAQPPGTPVRQLAEPPCPEGCGHPIHTGPCNGSQQ